MWEFPHGKDNVMSSRRQTNAHCEKPRKRNRMDIPDKDIYLELCKDGFFAQCLHCVCRGKNLCFRSLLSSRTLLNSFQEYCKTFSLTQNLIKFSVVRLNGFSLQSVIDFMNNILTVFCPKMEPVTTLAKGTHLIKLICSKNMKPVLFVFINDINAHRFLLRSQKNYLQQYSKLFHALNNATNIRLIYTLTRSIRPSFKFDNMWLFMNLEIKRSSTKLLFLDEPFSEDEMALADISEQIDDNLSKHEKLKLKVEDINAKFEPLSDVVKRLLIYVCKIIDKEDDDADNLTWSKLRRLCRTEFLQRNVNQNKHHLNFLVQENLVQQTTTKKNFAKYTVDDITRRHILDYCAVKFEKQKNSSGTRFRFVA